MPATSTRELLSAFTDTVEPLVYRVAAYFVLSILDDPAMLAFAFC
jgi:hypothetical protein